MFSVYWLIQRQYWIIHIACFPIFFSSGTSKREKKYFIWQLICVSLRIKPRGMEPQWSPCKAFSLTDIETIVVWSVSFSIIWQRHWERIGKILSSNCKHVLKVRGEYQRICLHEVFIQLYKTGALWICQLSIKEDLDFGRSFHSTRQVARLYNYCQLERTSNLAKFQLKLPRKYWICVLGEKIQNP